MLRRSYDWTMRLAAHRRALPILGLIAFIESSFFPIPPDAMLVPMVLAKPKRAWLIATVCTVGSVAGGVVGYLIGYYLFDVIAQPVIDLYNYEDIFDQVREGFSEHGALIVSFFGLTIFPYKIITITSGFIELDLGTFILASILSRGVRFFLVAGLLFYAGDSIRRLIERRLGLLTTVLLGLVILGLLAFRYIL